MCQIRVGRSNTTSFRESFRDWLKELKEVVKYKVERYIFGKTKDGFNKPPPRDEIEIHVFCDAGGEAYGSVAFIRWPDGSIFRMRRLFASSKVVSPSSNLSVPRRELCSLVLGNKIGQELAEELQKKFQEINLNLAKTEEIELEQNIISVAQTKSNNLAKVQRTLLTCFKFLIKLHPRYNRTSKK